MLCLSEALVLSSNARAIAKAMKQISRCTRMAV
jgi:hypothetical protein